MVPFHCCGWHLVTSVCLLLWRSAVSLRVTISRTSNSRWKSNTCAVRKLRLQARIRSGAVQEGGVAVFPKDDRLTAEAADCTALLFLTMPCYLFAVMGNILHLCQWHSRNAYL